MIDQFLQSAKEFSKNPLGIIALFISLIYGFATLLLNSSATNLEIFERYTIILFIVIFPVIVLFTFYKLVTEHHWKLYAPKDYNNDNSFLRALSPKEKDEILEKEILESQITSTDNSKNSKVNHQELKNEILKIEDNIIKSLEHDLNSKADRDIGIGKTNVRYDAIFYNLNKKFTAVEIKYLRNSTMIHHPMTDRILYNAVIADKFANSDFKLLLFLVYDFDKKDIAKVKEYWEKKIEVCPVDITLKVLSKQELLNSYNKTS